MTGIDQIDRAGMGVIADMTIQPGVAEDKNDSFVLSNDTISNRVTSVSTLSTVKDNTVVKNMLNDSSSDIIMSQSMVTEQALVKVNNTVDLSVSDSSIKSSLKDSVGTISNLFIDQQKEIIDTEYINQPILTEDANGDIWQDIQGNQYSDRSLLQIGSTYFVLSSEAVYYSYDLVNNDVTFGLPVIVPINSSSYNVFKLYQNLETSTYYVYAFEDIPNNQVIYQKYLGNVNFVNGVPMGENIPKYVNLVKTSTLDPDTITFGTYTSSCKFKGENNNTYNVVLTEINVPEISFSYIEGEEIECSYSSEICLECNNSYIFLNKPESDMNLSSNIIKVKYGGVTYSDNIDEDKPSNIQITLKVIENILSDIVKKYSLYSGINVLSTRNEKYFDGFKQKNKQILTLSPLTLFIPTKIYTNPTTYDYIPYERITESSKETISFTPNTEPNADTLLTINISNSEYGSTQEVKIFAINESYVQLSNYTYTEQDKVTINDVPQNVYWKNIEGYECVELGDYYGMNIFIRFTVIGQDTQLNYAEQSVKGLASDVSKSIIHILSIGGNDFYYNKVQLVSNNFVVTTQLYKYDTIKLNDITSELYSGNMSYLDFLSNMTTIYNLEYIEDMSYNYGWKYDPQFSSMEYGMDVLFEREGINVSYSYWLPLKNSYVPYLNTVLEFNGEYYGSDIFDEKSTWLNDIIKGNSEFGYTYTPKLVQVYKRNIITGNYTTSNIEENSTFIRNNIETTYNTSSNIPFTLKNEYKLEFTGDYEYIEPRSGYILTKEYADTTSIKYSDIKKGLTDVPSNEYQSEQQYDINYIDDSNNQFAFNEFTIDSITYTYFLSNNVITITTNKPVAFNGEKNDKDTQNYATYTSTDIKSVTLQFIKKVLSSDKTIADINITIGDNDKTTFNEYFYTYKYDDYTNEENRNNYNSFKTKFSNVNTVTIKLTKNPNIYITLNNLNIKSSIDPIDKETINKRLDDVKTYIKSNYGLDDSTELRYSDKSDSSKSIKFNGNIIIESGKTIFDYEFYAPGKVYGVKQMVTTDGYWKRIYKENIKPLVNITYSYSSNSLDISNAYIVPTTRNERLGFVHQNRITYHKFVSSYTEEYKYTYFNSKNIQCEFNLNNPNNKLIENGNEIQGIKISENQKLTYVFTFDNATNIFSLNSSIGINEETRNKLNFEKISGGQINFYSDYKSLSTKELYNIFKELLTNTEKNNNFTLYVNTDYYNITNNEIQFRSKYYVNYVGDSWIRLLGLYIKRDVDNTTYYDFFCDPRTFTTNVISTELIDLHKRLTVTKTKKLEEVVLQDEEYISQNAQIDTPFGIVNGKKVIVTDQVYVPESYTTIVDIDPDTYEYVQRRVTLTDPYYAYTYEIEDIPLITAAYIYNDGDGIKIQGMEELISALTGNPTTTTVLDSNGNPQTIQSLPTSTLTKESFKKLQDTFSTYMTTINDSLSYIGKLNNSLKELPDSIRSQDILIHKKNH